MLVTPAKTRHAHSFRPFPDTFVALESRSCDVTGAIRTQKQLSVESWDRW